MTRNLASIEEDLSNRARDMNGIGFLRWVRTGIYRSISPIERFFGGAELPPLWLRRHAGSPGNFVSSASDTAAWIDRFGLVNPDSVVLDIGCGCGSMAPFFAQRLGEKGRYVGFDVHRPSIDWCKKHYRGDPRFTFVHAALSTPYSSASSAETSLHSYRFPLGDGEADFVIAKSVFTHLLEQDTGHYLREARRVLAPHGHLYLTFFLFDGRLAMAPPAFPQPSDVGSPVRWRLRKHPHAAVAYDREHIVKLFAASGLTVKALVEGFWPGDHIELRGQDQLILSRVDAPLQISVQAVSPGPPAMSVAGGAVE